MDANLDERGRVRGSRWRRSAGAAFRHLRGPWGVALLVGLTLLLLLSLMGVAAGLWPSLDLVNHFRPLLLAAAALGLVGSLVVQPGLRLPLALLALITCGLQAWYLLPIYLERVRQDVGTRADALVLVTANLHYANREMAPVVAFLRDLDPDLVFLQEVAPASLEGLQQGLADRYPHAAHCVDRRYCNLAILSHRPLSAAAASSVGRRHDDTLPRLSAPGWRFAEGALADPAKAAAGLLAEVGLADGSSLRLFAVHLSWPIPADRHAEQLRWIAERLAAMPSEPTILAGDFNATPWSVALADFEKGLPLARASQGVLSFPTPQRAPMPILAIDQVYLSDGLAAGSVVRGPDIGSDHYPLVARFARNPPAPE